MQPAVYLAGPISGLSFDGCTDWREYARRRLFEQNIRGWSPMRAKEALAALDTISGHGNEYAHMGPFATSRGVMTRDFFDCNRADVVLVNFLGATRPSIGTCMEVAWAFAKHIPIVCIMEKTGNIHDHGMIRECIDFRTDSIDEAKVIVQAILDTANVL